MLFNGLQHHRVGIDYVPQSHSLRLSAVNMAEAVGLDGLHSLEGFLCDLCGAPCDPQAQELNALDCTFSNCPPEASVYHQDCLEKYLKGIRLEK